MDSYNDGPNGEEDPQYDHEGEGQQEFEEGDDNQGDHNGDFDINFEEVNEDDDVELLYAKLRASKKARFRADEDAKLLENRIKLLKQEESRARKKINETKKRAKEIVTTKKRNVERQKQK